MSRDGKFRELITEAATQPDACNGKIKYATAAKAWAVITTRGKRLRQQMLGTVYRCRFCHGWHVARREETRGKPGKGKRGQ